MTPSIANSSRKAFRSLRPGLALASWAARQRHRPIHRCRKKSSKQRHDVLSSCVQAGHRRHLSRPGERSLIPPMRCPALARRLRLACRHTAKGCFTTLRSTSSRAMRRGMFSHATCSLWRALALAAIRLQPESGARKYGIQKTLCQSTAGRPKVLDARENVSQG